VDDSPRGRLDIWTVQGDEAISYFARGLLHPANTAGFAKTRHKIF
jgi:hypothetical protein